MRLWSIHPCYLDAKGLVALWREALLARKVLAGKTRGYRHHPQLIRFKDQAHPRAAIAFYLLEVRREAAKRGYAFKALPAAKRPAKIPVTAGQLDYEFRWLCSKLRRRDPDKLRSIKKIKKIALHPLFRRVKGAVEVWEKRP